MVPIPALRLPILLSAVIVFLAGNIAHMVRPDHKSDCGTLPDEDEVMAAKGKAGVWPGDSLTPRSGSFPRSAPGRRLTAARVVVRPE